MACPRCGDATHAPEKCGGDPNPLSNLWPKCATSDEKEKAEAAWVRDLFDRYSFRDIPVRSRPSQQIIPKSTVLNARNENEVDHQNKKDAFKKELQQMRDEKEKKPEHEQQIYYHSIRPGFTQSSKDDRLLTNHIRIFRPCQCWKYEIKNLPNNATRQKKKVLIETMIKRMAFLHQNRSIFTHDGNGTIISTTEKLLKLAKDHPEPHVKLTIDQDGSILRAETMVPSARSGPNGELGMVPIAIEVPAAAHVATIKFRNVFMGTVLERSIGINEVVKALNMLIAKAASNVTNTNYRTFQMGANKFFLCSGYESLPNHPPASFKGKGILEKNILDIHHGFFLTVKTGMGNGLLNINTATSAFYHPQSVYDYLGQVQSKQEIFGMDQHGLKGLRVYIKYERGHEQEDGIHRKDLSVNRPERRVRTIHKVGPLSVRDQTFSLKKKGEDKAEETTLEKYLHSTYKGLKITHPKALAINVGSDKKPEWYSPEHLEILPYQPWRGLIPNSLASSMIDKACRTPGQNLALIVERGLGALGISRASTMTDILAPYGFNVIGRLMTVPVRYAPPPKVTYAGGATVDSRRGSWNLRGVKHYRRAAISKAQIWVTIDTKDERNLVENFRNLLETELGMTASSIEIIQFVNDTNLTTKLTELGKIGASKLVDFVILINPWEEKDAYDEFRKRTDRVWGIPSICITWNKLWSNRDGNRLLGFVANNAMKVNSRMNGINHISDFEKNLPADVKMAETIIIGADVSHPGFGASPGTGSIAAMVGTMDPRGQLYAGSARPNEPRTEMIQEFSAMLKERLNTWKEKSRASSYPKNILYFRDGVSESQYSQVRENEVNKINGVFAELEAPNPRIMAITCTKRHHTRFYPRPGVNTDHDVRTGNTKPGTCVESEVTHPYYNDFFLQSHVGIKGTAKPTHYFVLQDDMKFSAQQLQDLIHSLCFTYARSTCSVSYATPAYYADRLCDRVRHYYSDWLSGKVPVRQPNKNENVTREHIGWQDFKKAWHPASVTGGRNPWHPRLDDKMFWL